ncbi:hypothetical protein F3Y22_tig00111689pilonHSYRG00124 [Hibiscus syriacus]|uniref:Histone deacetylase complex subunit SAP30 Sin3 binding domain-containing protein n=1 Tax=Hibiscus syriacus TaxID=106335 RepID=A0A6A2XIE2_HIBSY|nr:hypothetical protein F3Y22_tig00111689pilonHSYRG00124 [Hibiscus syriacus]
MLETMESSVNGDGFSQLPSYGDSSEEELSASSRRLLDLADGIGWFYQWHEVKLQRNALCVIEAPTGNEEDDDIEFENMQWNGSDMASDDTQKSHRSRRRIHKLSSSCHKTVSRSLSCDSQSKRKLTSATRDGCFMEILATLQSCNSIPNPSKEQLVDVVQRHFMSQKIDELQVIVGFIQAAKIEVCL